jgi:predicted small secreted protein
MKTKTVILAMLVLLLAGCNNTMSGFGKDMQQNGQKVEKSADSSN